MDIIDKYGEKTVAGPLELITAQENKKSLKQSKIRKNMCKKKTICAH